jgi:hypothetical protein
VTAIGIAATRILRFEAPVDDHFLRVPQSAVVHVGCRDDRAVEFWIREPGDGAVEVRAYRVFGTGQPIPHAAQYEGTAVAPGGQPVWHLLSASAIDGERT